MKKPMPENTAPNFICHSLHNVSAKKKIPNPPAIKASTTKTTKIGMANFVEISSMSINYFLGKLCVRVYKLLRGVSTQNEEKHLTKPTIFFPCP
jgi:hypothetical protein